MLIGRGRTKPSHTSRRRIVKIKIGTGVIAHQSLSNTCHFFPCARATSKHQFEAYLTWKNQGRKKKAIDNDVVDPRLRLNREEKIMVVVALHARCAHVYNLQAA